ncbi:hybrid sensor histidine kinase/response regulator, partial [bacterium]
YFVIPLFNVEYTMRIRKKEINTVEKKEVIVLNEQIIAFKRLADVLQVPQSKDSEKKNKDTEFIQVVIVTSADKKIAFQVEEILNEQEVMIKGLGKHLSRVNNIAGVTILGTGKIVPLLNIQDLVKTAANHKSDNIVLNKSEKDEKKQYSILIAEDSITSRTLLKNILEMAGYKVKTTIDGVDAFAELKESNYDLLISDVEMPRMDGFQLTAKVRAEKKLSHLPVILITSLNEKAHKEKGVDVGANAYIVKSDFNQSNLLDIIPRLL